VVLEPEPPAAGTGGQADAFESGNGVEASEASRTPESELEPPARIISSAERQERRATLLAKNKAARASVVERRKPPPGECAATLGDANLLFKELFVRHAIHDAELAHELVGEEAEVAGELKEGHIEDAYKMCCKVRASGMIKTESLGRPVPGAACSALSWLAQEQLSEATACVSEEPPSPRLNLAPLAPYSFKPVQSDKPTSITTQIIGGTQEPEAEPAARDLGEDAGPYQVAEQELTESLLKKLVKDVCTSLVSRSMEQVSRILAEQKAEREAAAQEKEREQEAEAEQAKLAVTAAPAAVAAAEEANMATSTVAGSEDVPVADPTAVSLKENDSTVAEVLEVRNDQEDTRVEPTKIAVAGSSSEEPRRTWTSEEEDTSQLVAASATFVAVVVARVVERMSSRLSTPATAADNDKASRLDQRQEAKCRSCGATLPPNAAFCPMCGAKRPMEQTQAGSSDDAMQGGLSWPEVRRIEDPCAKAGQGMDDFTLDRALGSDPSEWSRSQPPDAGQPVRRMSELAPDLTDEDVAFAMAGRPETRKRKSSTNSETLWPHEVEDVKPLPPKRPSARKVRVTDPREERANLIALSFFICRSSYASAAPSVLVPSAEETERV
jgi:hypothetical protein